MVPNCLFENARKGGYKKAAFREQALPAENAILRVNNQDNCFEMAIFEEAPSAYINFVWALLRTYEQVECVAQAVDQLCHVIIDTNLLSAERQLLLKAHQVLFKKEVLDDKIIRKILKYARSGLQRRECLAIFQCFKQVTNAPT